MEDTPLVTQRPQGCTEAASMLTIVDFPTLVQEALTVFGDVFDTAPARRHFAEYGSWGAMEQETGVSQRSPLQNPYFLRETAKYGEIST